jgi:prepilin-type N-terminal cleavage/methylation domain-containing protein
MKSIGFQRWHVSGVKPAQRGTRPRAFTLVELLVVIAITAILAACLPVLAHAKGRGHFRFVSAIWQLGLASISTARPHGALLTTWARTAFTRPSRGRNI